MDDPSLLPFVTNNGSENHYSTDIDDEIEHEEDELDDDEDDDNDDLQNFVQIQQYPEDEIDEDEIEEDEIDDEDGQEILLSKPPSPPQPQPPPQQIIHSERGGRRKGVPRRLQLSPQINKAPAPQQRLLPLPLSKSSSSVHHQDQPILTSDQEDGNVEDLNNENHINDFEYHKQQNSIELDLLSRHLINNNDEQYDENNNYNDEENILEIVDDILADIVTYIVKDIRQQRQRNLKQQRLNNSKTNGYLISKQQTNGLPKSQQKQEQKSINGKHSNSDLIQSHSLKSSKAQSQQSLLSSKLSDPLTLFSELTKVIHLNPQQQSIKQKHSSTSPFSTLSSVKRQKTSETLSSQATTPLSLQQQQQHQQLLWQMTQQLMMSAQSNDTDSSSLLKQQLLGLTPPGTIPKRVGRPPKQQTQPQVMRSSTNMIPPTSHSTTSNPSFERGTFAPRRRGRPPKHVTERSSIPGLSSHDLDSSSYDQLLAAIENSVSGNSTQTSSSAFQSALASMLGHQAGLSIATSMPSSSVVRNGTPASMAKQSAGQTRHSVPSSKSSHGIGSGNGLDMPLMATKKRGPGRPPKTQLLLDSHQTFQATKRINSSSSSVSNNASNNNNFSPTMIPPSPNSFSLNFGDILQPQQRPH